MRTILSTIRIVSINGVKYFLPDTQVETLLILLPQYESRVWEYLKPVKGDVFIDLGAHAGKYALQVGRMVGREGLVVALEPHPNNYQALLKGIELNALENILPFNVAAWHKDCSLKLFTTSVSIYHSAKLSVGSEWIEVEARTVDSIIRELDVSHVDWVKIDVEGAEVEALRGLENTLSKYKPNLILEIRYRNLETIKQLATSHGYILTPIIGEQNVKSKVGLFFGKFCLNQQFSNALTSI